MDKEEFRIKLEEINRLVEKKDYKTAMEVVDSIDWRRVKNVHTLCVVGEIYAANKRYEDSKEIFLLAYHRAPIGKNILYRLIEISLKMKDINEAEEFYEEYLEVAPNDSTQYILKYKISREKQDSLEEQIKILEDYKENEFTERWSYELAKLYYQNGETEKCLNLCNEMILWFSEGKYVMKALDLKNRMGMLTGKEKEEYDKQFIPNLTPVEDAEKVKEGAGSAENAKPSAAEDEAPVIDSVKIDERDVNSAESLQEKISKGIRDIFNGKKKDSEEEEESAEGELQNTGESAAAGQELIRDISVGEHSFDVPELEPESLGIKASPIQDRPEETGEDLEKAIENVTDQEIRESGKEEDTLSSEESKPAGKKLPELEIPESMKNMGIDKPLNQNVPKAPDICLPKAEQEESREFNLEDTILAAASAQGINIPDDSEVIKKENRKENPVKETYIQEDSSGEEPAQAASAEEEPEEVMTEEDLRQAEEEFFKVPSHKKEDTVDFSALMEDEGSEEEDFEGDGYEDTDLSEFDDDEEFFKKVDMELNEDEPEEEIPKQTPKKVSRQKHSEPVKKAVKKTAVKQAPAAKKKKAAPRSEEEELEEFIDSIQPKKNLTDIVPREKKLTEDEEKLFTYFAKVPGLKEQIINTLCDVQLCAADKTSRSGNVIVMGGRETGKTRLISGLIPAICQELNLEASKVAYVFADQINGKNIASIVGKLSGGFLVIENANQLTKETVNQLNKAMEFRTDGLIVIIEDEKIGMRKLIARFPKFTSKFTSMINIPVFTNDELVNFAKVYTRENGYTIDQMGMLALYNQISMGQKADQPMNIGSVKEIVDNAIAKSRGGIRKLQRNVSKKRVNHDGYVVLYEKDFS